MRPAAFLLLMIPLLCTDCSKKNSTNPEIQSVEDLLLRDNEISGWRRSAAGWVANNNQELFQSIDGAAPPYIQHGFVEGAGQEYSGSVLQDTTTIILWIFNVDEASKAEALFNEMVVLLASPETWQTDFFQQAQINRSSEAQKIIAYKSKYYVSIDITSGMNEALEVLRMFAGNVGSKIP